jgi:hypothetical protein
MKKLPINYFKEFDDKGKGVWYKCWVARFLDVDTNSHILIPRKIKINKSEVPLDYRQIIIINYNYNLN